MAGVGGLSVDRLTAVARRLLVVVACGDVSRGPLAHARSGPGFHRLRLDRRSPRALSAAFGEVYRPDRRPEGRRAPGRSRGAGSPERPQRYARRKDTATAAVA